MPDPIPSIQEENQRKAEKQRIAAIESISQPHVRDELEAMVNTRNATAAEIRERQEARFEKDVKAMTESRANAARNPNYRGLGWPTMRAAAEQAVEIRNRTVLESITQSHNEIIDQRLAELRENVLDRREAVDQAGGLHANRDRLTGNQNEVAGDRNALESRSVQSELQHLDDGRGQTQAQIAAPVVDWRRALNDPEYRLEIQRREFRGAASEVTVERSIASEHLHQTTSPSPETRGASNPEVTPTEAGKAAEKREQIDWRRIANDAEYRREVQAQEFEAAGAEVTRSRERPQITPTI